MKGVSGDMQHHMKNDRNITVSIYKMNFILVGGCSTEIYFIEW